MATILVRFPNNEQTGKIKKWRVTTGTMVSVGRVILLYQSVNDDKSLTPEKKLRATQFGRVKEIRVQEGEEVRSGQVILLLKECKHPTVINDLCAKCGADLRNEQSHNDKNEAVVTEASVPILHSIPELKVCPELAEKIGREDELRLLRDKKLALLVDLDQTIVHTTNDNIPALIKDVFHYQLYGPNSQWYHTKLRPGTRHFLTEMSKLYELHICTFGARNYAHTVAALLDKEGALFSYRILSRDECFNPASKTANLKALFPCGDDLVCIIDDREDVWQGCGNLVQVKPYHYFRCPGDIHLPPGLETREIGAIKNNEIPNFSEVKKDELKTEIDTKELSKDVVESENNGNGIKNTVPDINIKIDKQETDKVEDKLSIINSIAITDDKEIKDDSENAVIDDKAVLESENHEKILENKNNEQIIETKNNGKVLAGDNGKIVDTENNEKVLAASDNKKELVSENSEREIKILESSKVKNSEVDVKDDDHDDYLLYLEDILRRIHMEFYSCIDKEERKALREVIPHVRAQVLKGLCLTFSGLIPTHQKLNQSRAYRVAVAFGAEVTQDLTEKTTHLVAIKPGTAKVNNAKKNSKLKIVNPDWLWSCAERWEHVDERLFPLTANARGSRIPPPHCSSPDRVDGKNNEETDSFVNTINPLMSFTQEEIDNMDKEVDEDMSDIEMDDSVVDTQEIGSNIDNESDESIDLNDELYQPVKKRPKIDEGTSTDDDNNEDDDDEDDDDDPITVFRRGGPLPDLDLGENGSQDSTEIPDIVEEDDDREWNAMGAALEREFLSD